MRYVVALVALLVAVECGAAEPKPKAAPTQEQIDKQRLKDAIADKQKEIQDTVRLLRNPPKNPRPGTREWALAHSGNPQKQVDKLRSELAALKKLKSLPPPINPTPKFPQEFSVGSSGRIYDKSARVVQVIDGKTFRAEVHLAWGTPLMTVFVEGIDTEDLVDDAKIELPSVMEVVGTRKYITASGVSRKEFVISQPKARKATPKE